MLISMSSASFRELEVQTLLCIQTGLLQWDPRSQLSKLEKQVRGLFDIKE